MGISHYLRLLTSNPLTAGFVQVAYFMAQGAIDQAQQAFANFLAQKTNGGQQINLDPNNLRHVALGQVMTGSIPDVSQTPLYNPIDGQLVEPGSPDHDQLLQQIRQNPPAVATPAATAAG